LEIKKIKLLINIAKIQFIRNF